MNICEIKTRITEINSLPLMKYEDKKRQFGELLQEISGDERKGVLSLGEKLKKNIAVIDKEVQRVRGMMTFENKYADAEFICGTDEVGRGPLVQRSRA